MTIQRFFLLMFSFLLFAPFAQAQKGKDQVKQTTENHHTDQHQHTHQDSSYHYGLCAFYLFDADSNGRIGGVNKNDSGGFGVRLNINQVKKKNDFNIY